VINCTRPPPQHPLGSCNGHDRGSQIIIPAVPTARLNSEAARNHPSLPRPTERSDITEAVPTMSNNMSNKLRARVTSSLVLIHRGVREVCTSKRMKNHEAHGHTSKKFSTVDSTPPGHNWGSDSSQTPCRTSANMIRPRRIDRYADKIIGVTTTSLTQ